MKSVFKIVWLAVGLFLSFVSFSYGNEVVVSIPESQGNPSSSVEIPVNINNAGGVAGFQFTIIYDSSVLQATQVTAGSLTNGWPFGTNNVNLQNPGEIRIATYDPNLNELPQESSGSLCILKFNVVGGAGQTTNLLFTFSKLTNSMGNPISHITQDGTFTVVLNPATINGTISYSGTKQGIIYIALFTSPDYSGDPAYSTQINSPGTYTISNISPGTYYVAAYRDSNNNSDYDPEIDPVGIYENNPITLSEGEIKTGINITLKDPPEFVIQNNITSINVPEGGSNTFRIKLSAQPSGNVVVNISVSGDTDISVSPSSITFTPTNWNTYQTITVSAAEDIDVANGSATITISATGIQSKTITATEVDNDTLSFVIENNITSINVPEGGNNTFGIKLSNQPSNDINVSITVSGDSDISVSPSSITFTPTNWNIYQTITISAAEDVDVANGSATITISATGIQSKTITATEVDNDTLSFVIENNITSIEVPEGESNTFRIKLSNQPSGNVVVNISVSGDTDISVSPTSITFTPQNWNTYQTITVSAKEDDDTTNGSATITISATGLTSKTLEAIEEDNEVPTLSVEPLSIVFKTSETEKEITVKNVGRDGLLWELIIEDITWLNVSPTSGGPMNANGEQTITLTRTGGVPGDSGFIKFKNKTEGSTQPDIEVNVRINTQPEVTKIEIFPPKDLNDIVKPETFITLYSEFEDNDNDKIVYYEWKLLTDSTKIDTGNYENLNGITKMNVNLPYALFEKNKIYEWKIRCKDENEEFSDYASIQFSVERPSGTPEAHLSDEVNTETPIFEREVDGETIRETTVVSSEIPPGSGVKIYVRPIDISKIASGLILGTGEGKRAYDIRVEGLQPGEEIEIKFEVLEKINEIWKYNPKTNEITPLSETYPRRVQFSPGSTPNSTLITIILKDGREPDDYDGEVNGVIVDPSIFGLSEVPIQVSGGGGCFIATACFGNHNHPFVKILREFRDRILLKNSIGRNFVKWYYRHSPKYAEIIRRNLILKFATQIMLIPVVLFAYLIVKGLLPFILLISSLFILRKKYISKLLILLILILSKNSFAQDINIFKIASGEKYTITSPTRNIVEKGKFQIDFIYSFSDDLLEGVVGGSKKVIVDKQNLVQIGLTYGLNEKANISVVIPYIIDQDVLRTQRLITEDSGFGDIYLSSKFKLYEDGENGYGVLIIPFIGLGNGKNEAGIGADEFVYGIKFAVDKWLRENILFSINLGYSHQKEVKISQVGIDDTFLFGTSLTYIFGNNYLTTEIYGRSDDGIFDKEEEYPIEVSLLYAHHFKNFDFVIGVGKGITKGYGTPNYRIFTGIKLQL